MIRKLYRKIISRLRESEDKIVRDLRKVPRYQPGTIDFLHHSLRYTDSASLLFTYQEIFKKGIYKFSTDEAHPYIIDAGANIGISILFFKHLFPQARITAFEPDENIFNVLDANIKSFNLSDVQLVNKGLWNEDKEIRFHSEGADAGRISDDSAAVTKISVTRLRPYLNERVDLLKIDIEGAETKVLVDCSDLLHHVDKIFVEYHSFIGEEQSLPELLTVLKNSGFRLNINTPGLSSRNPFLKVSTYNGMDMQLNIYGVRD